MELIRTKIDDPDLSELLDGIHRGTVGLPNFQRDFDWTDGDVRSLIATVLNGWPMGSLLLIDGDADTKDFYAPRPFQFAPALDGTPSTIVLDGQQRLTALYSSLYDASDLIYAVKCDERLDWSAIDSLDSAIRSFKTINWRSKFATPSTQWEQKLIPTSALRDAATFYEWRDSAASTADDIDFLTQLYRRNLAGLHRYRVPALRIDKRMPPAAVARIFERVNKTGRRLGVFDLMVAKSFTPSFNLRVEWDRVCDKYSLLKRFFKDDGTAILQVIALRNLDDVRSSAVLRLTAASIHDDWERAARAMNDALVFAQQRLGLSQVDWLPYGNLLVVLGALAWDGSLGGRADALEAWYWRSAFSGRYAVGSNTTAVSDFKLLRNIDGVSDPVSFAIDKDDLLEATRQSSGALHRAWLSVMASSYRRGRDPEEELELDARSVLPRGTEVSGKQAHLLSLGFALTLNGELIGPLDAPFLSPPAVPVNLSEAVVDQFLAQRATAMTGYLNGLPGIVAKLMEVEGSSEGVADA